MLAMRGMNSSGFTIKSKRRYQTEAISFSSFPVDPIQIVMNTTNELIAAIVTAAGKGSQVKAIRKQKYAPSQFYMSLTTGQQLGPVNVQGDEAELTRKFDEAQSYLETMKTQTEKSRKAA